MTMATWSAAGASRGGRAAQAAKLPADRADEAAYAAAGPSARLLRACAPPPQPPPRSAWPPGAPLPPSPPHLHANERAAAAGRAAGHGAMVHPRSRNSVDYLADVPPADKHTFASCVNVSGTACENGQSAYWYSQGCAFLSPPLYPSRTHT